MKAEQYEKNSTTNVGKRNPVMKARNREKSAIKVDQQ